MFAGVYLTLSMALTSLSVIFTVWVLKLHHNGVYQVPVPPSLRRFVLGRLARFVCPKSFTSNTKVKALKRRMRETSDEHSQRLASSRYDSDLCLRLMGNGSHTSTNAAPTRSPLPSLKGSSLRNVNRTTSKPFVTSSMHDVVRHLDNHVSSENSLYPVSERASSPRHHKPRVTSFSTAVHPKQSLPGEQACQTMSGRSRCDVNVDCFESERLALLERILTCVTQLVRKHDDADVIEEVAQEWRLVAFVIDRSLFWLFLFITSVGTLFILVLVPLLRNA